MPCAETEAQKQKIAGASNLGLRMGSGVKRVRRARRSCGDIAARSLMCIRALLSTPRVYTSRILIGRMRKRCPAFATKSETGVTRPCERDPRGIGLNTLER